MKLNIRNIKEKFNQKSNSKSSSGASSGLPSLVLKGMLSALIFSLIGILVFAFLLKLTNIPESAISPVNMAIKGISIFFGIFIALKKQKELGLVSGLLIGLFYTILAFLIFSILGGSFHFDISLVNDIVFGSIMGAICGVICINLKKSSR